VYSQCTGRGDLRGEKAGGDAYFRGIGSCIEDRMSLKMVNKMRGEFLWEPMKRFEGNLLKRDPWELF
jgi:hypothetical protein